MQLNPINSISSDNERLQEGKNRSMRRERMLEGGKEKDQRRSMQGKVKESENTSVQERMLPSERESNLERKQVRVQTRVKYAVDGVDVSTEISG